MVARKTTLQGGGAGSDGPGGPGSSGSDGSDGSSGSSSSAEEGARGSTRDRLVEVSRQLFLAKGYGATGIAEILREAGINSGSLYYFFKTKEALLLAVLDWYQDALYPWVIDPAFAKSDDSIERVFLVLEGYRRMLLTTGCRQGCPIGNLALEMSERSEAVRAKVAVNFENWRKAIGQCLLDAGARLAPDVDRDKLATFILTVMEGAVMQARAFRSTEPFDSSVVMLREFVDRLLVEGGGPSVAKPAAPQTERPKGAS